MSEIVVHHQANSTLAGRRQAFRKESVRLGRQADGDVVFDADRDALVSTRHAQLVLSDRGLFVQDLGSTNGTFVNGRRIEGTCALRPGDRVSLGSTGPVFTVEVRRPDVPPLPGALGKTPTRAPSRGSVGRSTMMMAIQGATRTVRTRMLLLFGGVIVLLLGLGAFWAITSERSSRDAAGARRREEETRKEVARLMEEIRAKNASLADLTTRQGESEERQRAREEELKGDLARLGKELAAATEKLRDRGERWTRLIQEYERSVFLLYAYRDEGDTRVGGIGTCFVVGSKGLLATNAHVETLIDDAEHSFVVQNRTGRRFEIRRHRRHSGFKTPNSDDVAIIEVDAAGATLRALPLADEKALRQLRPGTELGTIGFPGEFAMNYLKLDPGSSTYRGAEASFQNAVVSRIVDYDGKVSAFPKLRFIQHNANTTSGTSGSPVFTDDGAVIGLHNAGLLESKAQLNFAIRVDALKELIRDTAWAAALR